MREIESRGLSVDAESRGRRTLLQVLLWKNDALLEKSSQVLKVMSTKSTQNNCLDDGSEGSSNCSSKDD